jgi:hypothetical protein
VLVRRVGGVGGGGSGSGIVVVGDKEGFDLTGQHQGPRTRERGGGCAKWRCCSGCAARLC